MVAVSAPIQSYTVVKPININKPHPNYQPLIVFYILSRFITFGIYSGWGLPHYSSHTTSFYRLEKFWQPSLRVGLHFKAGFFERATL